MLFDFNMLPQYLAARSPATLLSYKIGLRKPWSRDYRHLKDFENWSNRVRCYKVPFVGVKIRMRLLNLSESRIRRVFEGTQHEYHVSSELSVVPNAPN